jgi:hypothetical protein
MVIVRKRSVLVAQAFGTSALGALLVGVVVLTSTAGIAQQATEATGKAEDRGGWRGACAKDLKTLCRGSAGGSAKRICLDSNVSKLSPACQASLVERRRVRAETLKSCSAELVANCKDATALGKGAQIKCLQDVKTPMSPQCTKAIGGLAEVGGPVKKVVKN